MATTTHCVCFVCVFLQEVVVMTSVNSPACLLARNRFYRGERGEPTHKHTARGQWTAGGDCVQTVFWFCITSGTTYPTH